MLIFRDFQINVTETPRKNFHALKTKNLSVSSAEVSSSSEKLIHISTPTTVLDLESLQSFPSLVSSVTSTARSGGSDKRHSDLTLNNTCNSISNKENSERKIRRVKLFSETVEGSFKDSNNLSRGIEFLDGVNSNFAISTPAKNNSLPVTEYFNRLDLQEPLHQVEFRKQLNNYSPVSPNLRDNNLISKSKSFSGELVQSKCKENKTIKRNLNEVHNFEQKTEIKSKVKHKINPTNQSNFQAEAEISYRKKSADFINNKLSFTEKQEPIITTSYKCKEKDSFTTKSFGESKVKILK